MKEQQHKERKKGRTKHCKKHRKTERNDEAQLERALNIKSGLREPQTNSRTQLDQSRFSSGLLGRLWSC